jgi:hypothetical protein
MKPLCRKLCLTLLITLFALVCEAANFNVTCGKTGTGLHTINAALAKISEVAKHQELGPNTITVTGACVENLLIASLDNLTLQASAAGASISDASGGALDTVLVIDSTRFALNNFTINGSVNCANNAVCRLFGNTIQNSQVGWGLRASRAHVDSVNDSISNNPSGAGIISTNDSRIAVQDDTISNNGGRGIQVTFGSLVFVSAANTVTTISNNADHGIFAATNGTIRLQFANITGNAGDGIRVQDGSTLRTDFVAPSVNNISGNGGSGVNLGDLSDAWFAPDGSMNITGNLSGLDVYCAGQFVATRWVGFVGGTTNCVEPNPEAPSHKSLEKERLKPF